MTLKQIAKTNGKNYNSYMQFISHSVSDTMLFAESIADKCKGNEIIILNGDLGSGKTTFTKGFAKTKHVVQMWSNMFIIKKQSMHI